MLMLTKSGLPMTLNININQAQANDDVGNGMFLVNDQYSSIFLIRDKCFVSLEFASPFTISSTRLDSPYVVEVANRKNVSISSLYIGCVLKI